MMIQLNYLAFAIPAFFIFLFLEYQLAIRLNKLSVFKYEGSISNLSIGIAERLLNLFISASFYSLFYWVYKNYALFNIPNTWWVWILLILTTDLVWYWYHRLGHTVNFLWAAHIVHHQSEEFNLTVSARITVFQALIRNIFWCFIPLLGFQPAMVISILIVHGAYSFFTHTQLIGKLPWLEQILITPSLHGVHHASDEKYLDKNYGDIFVFWDKLFGTFQQEEEAPRYGLTHPIKSYSFLWQHFHYYLEMAEACRRAVGFKAKMRILFGSPAAMDQDIRPALEKKYLQHKPVSAYRFKFKTYLDLQLTLCIALLTFITAAYGNLGSDDKSFIVCFILLTLINCGALMEQKKWIYYLECIRLIVLLAFIFWKLDIFGLIVLPAVALIALESTFRLSHLYRSYVLRYEKI
ncbi:sterol desaturase family protein [Pedobacter heparinus]|uniref:Fatty acid hydroxylase n=1 Tax=Pedobacter heparinus (strain ATCC 13125 / DSM 2366 / CIP 104194 / JCM 7457 / NBRC 12017 / NCIMB 9290 / NRRL B-14731 / HIM 762-3) TaxID=485917 RepID=C6Y3A4_PEDHD|nr:sterol desaturase family protein [Pedobacter heparinus]ACU05329.1 fatty acid hydroxylase [Pedobacter heparinus DSM 2366]